MGRKTHTCADCHAGCYYNEQSPSRFGVPLCFDCLQKRRKGDAIDAPTVPEPTAKSAPTIEFPDKKTPEFDADEWLAYAQKGKELYEKASASQDIATVKIKTDARPGIIFSSDWHLGSAATDYLAFIAHIDYVLNTPNLFMAVVGDAIENVVKFRSLAPIFDQVIQPRHQRMLLGEILDRLVDAGKLLFTVWGNHDVEKEETLAGESVTARLLAKDVPYLPGIGFVKLQVNGVEYIIEATHKARYHSILNELHGNNRLHQLNYPADVVVTAHTHKPAIADVHRFSVAQDLGKDFGGDTLFIKCGTFKTACSYSQRYFEQGIIGIPTIVFGHEKKEMIPFKAGPVHAVRYMRGCES